MFRRNHNVVTRTAGTCSHHSIPLLESLESRALLSVVMPASTTAATARDARFLQTTESHSQLEIELGTLAQSKAISSTVKQVAAAFVADATVVETTLGNVAAAAGVALSGNLNHADQAIFNHLSKLTGVQFDRAFGRAILTTQRKELDSFVPESLRSNNASIQNLIASDAPVVKVHLVLAQTARVAALVEKINTQTGVGTSRTTTTGTAIDQATPAATATAINTGVTTTPAPGITQHTFTTSTTNAGITGFTTTGFAPITRTFGGSGNLATGIATGSGGTLNIANGSATGTSGTLNIASGTTIGGTFDIAQVTNAGGTVSIANGSAVGLSGTFNIAAVTDVGGTVNIADGSATGMSGTFNIAAVTNVGGTVNIADGSATGLSGTVSIAG